MAEKFCTSCGAKLTGDSRFCTECGASIPITTTPVQTTSAQTTPVQTTTQAQVPNPALQVAYQDNFVPGKDSKYEPISTWGYIGIMLLMAIPLIGPILVIVWALGGCRKINKRNLARATVIMSIVGIIISIIMGLLIKSAFNTFMEESGINDALKELEDLKDEYGTLEDIYNNDYQYEYDDNEQSTGESLVEEEQTVDVSDDMYSQLESLEGLENIEDMEQVMDMLEMFQGLFGK